VNIAIMGSGGLGGYIGGCLAHAGNNVYFIARRAQLEAIRQNGLQVKSTYGDFHVQPAQATDNTAEIGLVDLILLSVKSYDVAPAIEAMRPMVGA
jgi:2-dehydropantoate 2-reductase